FTTRLLLNTIAKTEMYTLSLHDALPIYAVIYYQRDNFLEGSERYDIIFDVASNLRFKDCTRVLTETGKYLVIGHDHYGTCGGRLLGSIPHMFRLVALTPFTKHLPRLNFSTPNKAELMEELRELIEAGKITPLVDKTYPLGEAREALRSLAEGRLVGKPVLTP